MFSNLVESKAKRPRRRAGTIASFVAHYGLILGVLYTSASAKTANDRPRVEKVAFVQPKKEPEVPKTQQPPDLVVAPKPMKIDPMLIAPIEVPNALPEIDLSRPVTDPNAFTNGPSRPSTSGPTESGVAERDPSRDYFAFQVEQPAAQAPGSASPVYPDILRQAGVEGEALVTFVVDTSGRVDVSTFKVVRSTHDLFAAAVRNALPRMRFIPAMVDDRKVRQLVQQPFSFAIVK